MNKEQQHTKHSITSPLRGGLGGFRFLGPRGMGLFAFASVISLFTLVAFNLPVFSYAWTHASMGTVEKAFVVASLGVIMLALNMMLTYVLVYLLRIVGRLLIAVTLIIDALAEYFVLVYSVMLDDTMMSNIFNTRYSEASGYFSYPMLVWVVVLGVFPAIWVVWQPVVRGTKKQLAKVCGGALGVSLLLIVANINHTLWISNNDTELGGLSMPWSYIANTYRYINMHHVTEEPERQLPKGEISDTTRTAVVLVIGESARRDNFSLYGYKRLTNPLLAKQQGLTCYDAQSCATYTTAGVRAILEPKDDGPLFEILPNYAQRCGVDVSWRTANWGEPPVKAKEYLRLGDLEKMFPKVSPDEDGILFCGLKERIVSSKSRKVLIILHTTTSHGPDYCLRVPKSFHKFQPVLDNIEEAEKNPQALINAYDNSILYTDYLLSGLIDTLRTMEGWQTAMMFVSDHGESLGENEIYMHGIPKDMAPKQQYQIPFLVWTSDGFRTLKPKAKIDQHWVFHSVIDLLGIKTEAYNGDRDVFATPKAH